MAVRSGFLAKLTEPMWDWAARSYQASVGKELKKYGLRYDDLLDPEMNMDVAEAMSRLPQQVLDDRNARLKRALDLSLKHVYLSKEMQAKQTPFEFYLTPTLQAVEAENAERIALGTAVPYNRSIP
mmetsp:Transcript_22174/g.30840  ORF Transcript_22174/g.30840 Transcript_22174/m.30840 type:complete len:126 (-) Transcript_22174:261-638(-)|eukprot:CAMPEP_0196579524 /NCGR_PEP_ID=MMETSP1081-20130531/22214_1 /TAXON_ID=36882 /ORGANISM="Pyramimonas amylifera, Strain CCMP720" /LENGTH=125 /DNA_ID=CAMNT_0041899143 /DNA_START=79 /DNA_END=456 /DNA_ORIENTATION=-